MSKVVLITLVAIVVRILPRKTDFFSSSEELLRRLPARRYDELVDFAEEGARNDNFWPVSHGVVGLFERLRISHFCVRLVYALCRESRIEIRDALTVCAKLLRQAVCTMIALPEAGLCCILGIEHRAARCSLRSYCDLLIRTSTLCPILARELL